jgi:PleD family two-component response regulator
VTVSVGVAAAGPGAPDPGEMLEAADAALLQAIAAGGDQVRLAPG